MKDSVDFPNLLELIPKTYYRVIQIVEAELHCIMKQGLAQRTHYQQNREVGDLEDLGLCWLEVCH